MTAKLRVVNSKPWLPGATTVLRVQDALSGSDALTQWAARTAVEATFGGAYATAKEAIEAGQAAVTFARDRGTRVHYGIEAMLADEEHIPSPDTHAYWYGWSRFLVRERPEFIATERKVINETLGYGTTMDIVAKVRGKVSQLDVKSGSVKDTHVLQLAAGDMAEKWDGAQGVERNRWHQYRAGLGEAIDPMPLEAHYVLHLDPSVADGYELIPFDVTDDEREHFAFLVRTYHQLKAWKNAKREEAAA